MKCVIRGSNHKNTPPNVFDGVCCRSDLLLCSTSRPMTVFGNQRWKRNTAILLNSTLGIINGFMFRDDSSFTLISGHKDSQKSLSEPHRAIFRLYLYEIVNNFYGITDDWNQKSSNFVSSCIPLILGCSSLTRG